MCSGGTRFELRRPSLPPLPNDQLEYTEASYIHLKVSLSLYLFDISSNNNIILVCPVESEGNVRPVLPPRPAHQTALPVSPGDPLPGNRPVRSPHPPPQPVQPAVQHASCPASGHRRRLVPADCKELDGRRQQRRRRSSRQLLRGSFVFPPGANVSL